MDQINSINSTSMLGLPSSLTSGLTGGLTGGLSGSSMSTSSMGMPGGISEMLTDAAQIMAAYGVEDQSASGGADIAAMMKAMMSSGGTSSMGMLNSGSTSSMGMPGSSMTDEYAAILKQIGQSSGTGNLTGLTGLGNM